jgi:hypothetical protein
MAKGKRVIVTSNKPKQPTRQDLEHAADDARVLIGQSTILQSTVTALIASRRLYMLARSVLDNEIEHGWDVTNPELVIQTMEMSAQEKAMENFKALDVQQMLIAFVLPFVDIAVQQEAADAVDQPPTQPETNPDDKPNPDEHPGAVLPGDQSAGPAGLADVRPGAPGSEEH